MAAQATRRLEAAMPEGGRLAAKSGGLFGRVRNEIAVISHPDGSDYAVAILTRTRSGFGDTTAINAAMADAIRLAIAALRA
jgi:beta-lactamase class A